MEKTNHDKKEQSNSLSASLKSMFTASLALWLLVAIFEGTIFGFLLKILTRSLF